MNVTKRMGTFFVVIGVALLVLFFASDYLDMTNGWYLLGGTVAFGLGLALSARGREPHEPVERFRLLRRMFGGGDKEKDKQENPFKDEENNQ